MNWFPLVSRKASGVLLLEYHAASLADALEQAKYDGYENLEIVIASSEEIPDDLPKGYPIYLLSEEFA